MYRSITSCLLVLLLGACAAEPIAKDRPAAAPAPAAPAAAPKATAENTSSLPPKLLSGYKLRMRDGKKYYCTKEAVLGSHFEKTICLTEEQVAEVEQRRQEQRDDLEKAQKACGGTMCTSGP